MSKSLQILEEKNHAGLGVVPEGLFCNGNGNWFLYDGYFVVGHRLQGNFVMLFRVF